MARILVADDEHGIRALLRLTLVPAGHSVVEAADGDEALALARTHRPDIVILDVWMPGLSGLDVCRAIRADSSLAGTRVIIASGHASDADALAAGADAVFAKPFSPARLLAAVEAFGSGADSGTSG